MDIGYDGSYPSTAQDGWGIFLGGGTNSITISNTVIHNVAGAGIEMSGAVSNVTVANSQIHNMTGGAGSDGIDVTTDSTGAWATNLTFTGDTIWNTSDNGFDIKGTNVTLTNCAAHGITGSDYTLSSPNSTTQQGSFTMTNDIGYAAGQTVVQAVWAPILTITNSSFRNGGAGETTFIYDGGMPWGGNLTTSGDKFYYAGTTSSAVAADIQKQNATLKMDNDQYYNSSRTTATFVVRNGTASTTYGNAAFNNGSFYAGQGQEQHGHAVLQNIAPYLVSTSLPAAAAAASSASFSAVGLDAQQRALTYTWTFGDGTAAVAGASVKHTFAASGTYQVTLVIGDGVGKTTIVQTLTVL
jgi:hypothetical protein